MMEREVVDKRKWMSREHFLDLIGATNLIPGPNSTEMTMHCGHERAGWKGLIVAGVCFIFPAVILTGLLAYVYVNYGGIPEIAPFFIGIKPAVLAIILAALIKLGKKALKSNALIFIGAFTVLLSFAGLSEILCILSSGLISVLIFTFPNTSRINGVSGPILVSAMAKTASSSKVFLTFLKMGSILFGSGYVLVAYLNDELVEKLGWLTKPELLDAIAMGQFTPGPVLSTATFVGYQVNGLQGAIAATLGMFLPSFIFVWLLNPIIPKLRKSKIASFFLDGVNVGALAVMLVVLLLMIEAVILPEWKVDSRALLIALLSGFLVFYKKLGSVWIVLGGMLVGYILYSL